MDEIKVTQEKARMQIDIRSPKGISKATIDRPGDLWPETVVLRLHLKGLESLQITSDRTTLHAAVASHREGQRIRLWKNGEENAPLDAKHPLWMEIQILDAEGKAKQEIPLQQGYFQMLLPRALLQGNPQSLQIRWIDFYR